MKKYLQTILYTLCATTMLAAPVKEGVSGSSTLRDNSGSSTLSTEDELLPTFGDFSSYKQQADVNFNNQSLSVTGGFVATIAGTKVIGDRVVKLASEKSVTLLGSITVYSPQQGGMIFTATKAIYYLESKSMELDDLRGYASQMFFTAKSAKITSQGDIRLTKGSVSTDGNLVVPGAIPEYSIQGSEIFIRPTESISGVNLTATLQGKNIFYFPWYAGSLEPQGPNLFPLPGNNGTYGNYLLWGSYYHLNSTWAQGYFNTRWSEKNGWYIDQWMNRYQFSSNNSGSIVAKNILAIPKSGVSANTWDVTWNHHLTLPERSGWLGRGEWDSSIENIALNSLTDSSGNTIQFSSLPKQGSYWKTVVKGEQNIGSNGVFTANLSDANLGLTQQILSQGATNNATGLPAAYLWDQLSYKTEARGVSWSSFYDRENVVFPASNGGTSFSYKNNWGSSVTLTSSHITASYLHQNQDQWATTLYNPSSSLALWNQQGDYAYSLGVTNGSNTPWQWSSAVSHHQVENSQNDWYAVQNWLGMQPRTIYQTNTMYNQLESRVSHTPFEVGSLGSVSMNTTLSQNSYTTNDKLTHATVSAVVETPLWTPSFGKLTNSVPVEFGNFYGSQPTLASSTTSYTTGTSTLLATPTQFNVRKIGEGLTWQGASGTLSNMTTWGEKSDFLTQESLALEKKTALSWDTAQGISSVYLGDNNEHYAPNPTLRQSYSQQGGGSYFSKTLNTTWKVDYLKTTDFNTNNLTVAPNNAVFDDAISRTYSITTPQWGVSYQPVELSIANSNYNGTLAHGFLDNYTAAWSSNSLLVNQYVKLTYSHVRSISLDSATFSATGLTPPQDSLNLQFNLTDMRKFYHYWQEKQQKNVETVDAKAASQFNISSADAPADALYSTTHYQQNLTKSTSPPSMSSSSDSKELKNSSGSDILNANYTPYNLSSVGNGDKSYFYNSINQYGVGLVLNYDNQYYQQAHPFADAITNAGVNLTYKRGDSFYFTPQYYLSRTTAGTTPLTSNLGGEVILKLTSQEEYGWWIGTNYYKNYYNYQNPTALYTSSGQQTSKTWGVTLSHRIRELQISVGYEMNWDQFNHNFNNQINFSVWTVAFPTAMLTLNPTIN